MRGIIDEVVDGGIVIIYIAQTGEEVRFAACVSNTEIDSPNRSIGRGSGETCDAAVLRAVIDLASRGCAPF